MILMPTSAYGEADKDYAVSCAVPVDAHRASYFWSPNK